MLFIIGEICIDFDLRSKLKIVSSGCRLRDFDNATLYDAEISMKFSTVFLLMKNLFHSIFCLLLSEKFALLFDFAVQAQS